MIVRLACAVAALMPDWAAAAAASPYRDFQLSQAQERRMRTPAHRRCGNRAHDEVDWGRCLAEEQDRADAQLNAAYRAAMARLPNRARRIALRKLEREWLGTWPDECRRASVTAGATAIPNVFRQCALDETYRRLVWLRRHGR